VPEGIYVGPILRVLRPDGGERVRSGSVSC
jgi:hypothetical protein